MTHCFSRWAGRTALAIALCVSFSAQAQKVKLATSAGDIVIELDAAKAPKSRPARRTPTLALSRRSRWRARTA